MITVWEPCPRYKAPWENFWELFLTGNWPMSFYNSTKTAIDNSKKPAKRLGTFDQLCCQVKRSWQKSHVPQVVNFAKSQQKYFSCQVTGTISCAIDTWLLFKNHQRQLNKSQNFVHVTGTRSKNFVRQKKCPQKSAITQFQATDQTIFNFWIWGKSRFI